MVPILKNMTNNLLQTTVQSHFFWYFESYLSKNNFYFCITRCLIFSEKITLFPQISQILKLETLASINSYQLSMKYMCCLMRYMKFQVHLLTYQRHLIRFSMKVSSLSLNKMEYLANCYIS